MSGRIAHANPVFLFVPPVTHVVNKKINKKSIKFLYQYFLIDSGVVKWQYPCRKEHDMAEEAENKDEVTKGKRDRSPAFPVIPLKEALERFRELDKFSNGHPVPVKKAAIAWEMAENSSQSNRTLAALKYFGLIDYEGSGDNRSAITTAEGKNFLRALRDETKQEMVKTFALAPKEIKKFWDLWGKVRPHDDICREKLIFDHKYNEKAAPQFLRVYDQTIDYAGLSDSDKIDAENDNESFDDTNSESGEEPMQQQSVQNQALANPVPNAYVAEEVSQNSSESEWLRGPLSKSSSYRLIIKGDPGVKEIDNLINILTAQKAVLED